MNELFCSCNQRHDDKGHDNAACGKPATTSAAIQLYPAPCDYIKNDGLVRISKYCNECAQAADPRLRRARRAKETLATIAMFLLVVLAALLHDSCMPDRANASPVYLSVESGAGLFKWGDATYENGVPKFTDPAFDFSAAFEWGPGWLERRGFWLSAGFRYQSLGRSRMCDQTFIDGPRIAIKFRGRVTP